MPRLVHGFRFLRTSRETRHQHKHDREGMAELRSHIDLGSESKFAQSYVLAMRLSNLAVAAHLYLIFSARCEATNRFP